MALKKQLVSNNVMAEYWKVVGFNISLTGKLCHIFLLGYVTEEDFNKGVSICSRNYIIKQDKFDTYVILDGEDIRAKLYTFVKDETEDFTGAENYYKSIVE